MFPAWLSGSVTHEPSLSAPRFFLPLPGSAHPSTCFSALSLGLLVTWSRVSLSILSMPPTLSPLLSPLLSLQFPPPWQGCDSSWALGGRRNETARQGASGRTPEPTQALRDELGLAGCLSETGCTYACVSVCRCVTAPSSSLLPSSKILHKSAALLAVSFPLLEERNVVFPPGVWWKVLGSSVSLSCDRGPVFSFLSLLCHHPKGLD